MSIPLLSVENLSVSFRRDDAWTSVVKGVSFEIGARETVALVGESGSGKSVTALSVLQLLDRQRSRIDGAIRLNGRDLLQVSKGEMQRIRGNDIAMIFQEPMTSLNPVLTIGRQIGEVLQRHRGLSRADARREALDALDKVRIPSARARLEDYPHNLSGGMRQRVMIAMALACRPKLLIADEPTTALDVTIQAQILDLLRELQRAHDMSVLFITHDMGVVAEVADRMIVMYRGDVVETGSTIDVFNRQSHNYTRALLAAVPVLGSMRDEPAPKPFSIVDPVTGSSHAPERQAKQLAASDAAPVLEVRNLVMRYDVKAGLLGRVVGRVHAVEGISFSVRKGETLALVGESGCGKSTTGRSILRLVEPTGGQVLLDGEDVRPLSAGRLRSRRQSMQMIFQDPFASLNPSIAVGQAIMEPMLIHKTASRDVARLRAVELLERVGLSGGVFGRFAHEFSGGQRQRICIARALALEPRLIIADEAVSALDVSIKAQVVNLLLDLQASLELAYLFISHDMAVVERVSHRVAVMYLGEIVEIGPRAAVFGNPQHAYTRALMAAVPVPNPRMRQTRRTAEPGELKSPVRGPDYVPPKRLYRQVGPDHLVQLPAGEVQ